MKKFLLVAVMAIMSLGAWAQQGQAAVGINLNVSPCLEKGASLTNFGLAAKFQYNLLDALRGEVQAAYDFKSKGFSVFTGALNFHYLFNIGDKFKLYPIAGIGYGNVKYSESETYEGHKFSVSESEGKFLVNAGVGGEIDINRHFAVSLEVKYQYMKHFQRLPISLGAVYKF